MINFRTIYLAIVTFSAICSFTATTPILPDAEQIQVHLERARELMVMQHVFQKEWRHHPEFTDFSPVREGCEGVIKILSYAWQTHLALYDLEETLRGYPVAAHVTHPLEALSHEAYRYEMVVRKALYSYHTMRSRTFFALSAILRREQNNPPSAWYNAVYNHVMMAGTAHLIAAGESPAVPTPPGPPPPGQSIVDQRAWAQADAKQPADGQPAAPLRPVADICLVKQYSITALMTEIEFRRVVDLVPGNVRIKLWAELDVEDLE